MDFLAIDRKCQEVAGATEVQSTMPGREYTVLCTNVLCTLPGSQSVDSEDEKMPHQMKSIKESIYQALLTKDINTTVDFIKWWCYIEHMKQKRV